MSRPAAHLLSPFTAPERELMLECLADEALLAQVVQGRG